MDAPARQPVVLNSRTAASRGEPPQPPAAAASPIEHHMASLYDHYFGVRDYERRYPEPNRSTLAFVLRHGAASPREVLDFGCGNGRYAMALLRATGARVTGCDISAGALQDFERRLDAAGWRDRARLVHGNDQALTGQPAHDLVLVLFGVLSHVGDRDARLRVLRSLRAAAAPGARLVLTVPSRWRRRPWEAVRAAWRRCRGRARGVQAEPGNILFSRELGGVPHEFFYHLYTVGELRAELRAAGWEPLVVEAESVLPEWLVTQYPRLGRLDAAIARWLPASLGYGIRVAAVVAPGG